MHDKSARLKSELKLKYFELEFEFCFIYSLVCGQVHEFFF